VISDNNKVSLLGGKKPVFWATVVPLHLGGIF